MPRRYGHSAALLHYWGHRIATQGVDGDLPLLARGLAALGLALQPQQVTLLARYLALLLEWNQRLNLTAVTDPAEVEVRHFLDALSALLVLPPEARALVDLGAGAGLPGLSLAIARPAIHVTLVDSARKKVRFLEHVIANLALSNARALWGRAEELGQQAEHRERYDVATARAVAEVAVLAEYALPLLRIGGAAIFWKHGDVRAELEGARHAITVLGGGAPAVHPVRAPGLPEGRCLVVVRKERPTPQAYPRRPGAATKRPL
ncbi:MAG: 16S rRNA (guanine(527)-N(7))-methyltransferase RsmG [Chloroflexi bacterium]|nr:16S rRNA (guanine(527)-N(7))-methyltransferase RsmG [Chloroflexota bacterium]